MKLYPLLSLFFVVSVLSLIALPLKADTRRTGEVSVESNEITGGGDSQALLEVSSPGRIQVDFSQLGDEVFRIVWKAPRGKMIEFASPVEFDGAQLLLQFIAGSLYTGTGSFTDNMPTVSFERASQASMVGSAFFDLSGPAAGDGNESQINAQAFFSLPAGEVLRIKSASMETTVPASFDTHFVRTDFGLPDRGVLISVFRVGGTAAKPGGSSPADPGQWIRLVDDPVFVAKEKALKRKIKKTQRAIGKAKRAGKSSRVRGLTKKLKRLKLKLRRLD